MLLNSDRSYVYRKTFVLSYIIPDYSKQELARSIKTKLKHVTVLLIAEYSPKISPSLQNPINKDKYIIYLELDIKRRLSKSDTFEINGVRPKLKDYSKEKVMKKIKEKDSTPYIMGMDLNTKITCIESKKNSIYAENIYLLKSGEITVDDIREKYPVDWSNNKRKYREFAEEENTVRKRRRIENNEMLPSKFKRVSIKIVKNYNDLKEIVRWYNFRLVNQHWNKNASGLYLWSRDKSVGKTKFISMLKKIDSDIYEWDKNDRGWQSSWIKGKDYSVVVFNAVNSGKLVPFNTFEDFGDDESTITINKKYDSEPDYISARTPWIITSNKPPSELYPKEDIEILEERCVVVELEGPLFELINIIARTNDVEESQPDKEYKDSEESDE